MFNFLSNISTTEIILIIAILLILFGPKLIRGLGRTSGETLREVKKVKKEFTKALEDDDESDKK